MSENLVLVLDQSAQSASKDLRVVGLIGLGHVLLFLMSLDAFFEGLYVGILDLDCLSELRLFPADVNHAGPDRVGLYSFRFHRGVKLFEVQTFFF